EILASAQRPGPRLFSPRGLRQLREGAATGRAGQSQPRSNRYVCSGNGPGKSEALRRSSGCIHALQQARGKSPGSLQPGRGSVEKARPDQIGSIKLSRGKTIRTMKPSFMHARIAALAGALAASLAFAGIAPAQGTNPNKVPDKEQQADQDQQLKQRELNQAPTPAPPKVDPAEEAAYKEFYNSNPQDADTRIRLGEAFVQKYPMSRYAESVYAALTQAYSVKQDWKNFYADADRALALNPDDATVLVIVGWIIPHDYNPESPDAAKNLDKAERYEKH